MKISIVLSSCIFSTAILFAQTSAQAPSSKQSESLNIAVKSLSKSSLNELSKNSELFKSYIDATKAQKDGLEAVKSDFETSSSSFSSGWGAGLGLGETYTEDIQTITTYSSDIEKIQNLTYTKASKSLSEIYDSQLKFYKNSLGTELNQAQKDIIKSALIANYLKEYNQEKQSKIDKVKENATLVVAGPSVSFVSSGGGGEDEEENQGASKKLKTLEQNSVFIAKNQDKLNSATKRIEVINKLIENKDSTTELEKLIGQIKSQNVTNATSKAAANQKNIANALLLNTGSEIANGILLLDDTKMIEKDLLQIDKTLEYTGKTLTNQQIQTTLNLATQNQVSERMAALSAPKSPDMALVRAIKKLDGTKIADNSDSVLKTLANEYIAQKDPQNSLWANTFGSHSHIKNAPNFSLYGLSVGYDRDFDELILGGFVSYANAKGSSNSLQNRVNIYQIGTYARANLSQNEIEAVLVLANARNNIDQNVLLSMTKYTQNMKYNSFLTFASIEYGYVFKDFSAFELKPIIGASLSYAKNSAFDQTTIQARTDATKQTTLSLKLGLQARKYYNQSDYFYITPAVIADIYKHSNDFTVRFAGYQPSISYSPENKKRLYFDTRLGTNLQLNPNLSLDVSLGSRLSSHIQTCSANLGLKYKF